MEIPNLIGVQKGHLVVKKNGHNLLQNVLLKLNFPYDGHLYVNRLVYILTVYFKCLLFQFLVCRIVAEITILTGV